LKVTRNILIFFILLGILPFPLLTGSVNMNASLDTTLPVISSDMIIRSNEAAVDLIQTADGHFALLIDATDDVILAKFNSQGEVLWSHSYGMISTGFEGINPLIQTMDNGFAFAGRINSSLGLIKTDSEGTVKWFQTYDYEQWDLACSLIQTSDSGFALATTWRLLKFDENGFIQWEMNFAHLLDGERVFVIQTSDGGYSLAGSIYSSDWNDDIRVIKLNSQGQLEWFETYGGDYYESTKAFIQTIDSSFLVGGIYWEYTNNKKPQAFLLKINQDGIMIWNQTYGEGGVYSNQHWVHDLVRTLDGGFAFVGYDRLTKIDSNGVLQWEKQYGGIRDELLVAVIQDTGGNFVLAGKTYWGGGNVYPEGINREDIDWYDSRDAWLVKTDSLGLLQWQIAIDGLNDEEWGNKIIETDDNSLVLAGITNSYGTGQADMWIVKTNGNGSIEWNKTYGGVLDEGAESIIQTVDGGFVFIGFTASFGSGGTDIWLVKIDASGSMEWNRTYGGSDRDWGLELVQVSDGGFVIAGVTKSQDKWLNWIIKTDTMGVFEWEKTYSRTQDIRGVNFRKTKPIKFIQTLDNGFALAFSNELIKMDAVGIIQWNTTLEGRGIITSLIQTSDNNYILGGAEGFLYFHDDGYLVKISEEGVIQWTQLFEGSPVADVVQTVDNGFNLWIEDQPTIIKTGTNGVQQWNRTFDELRSEEFLVKREIQGIDLLLSRDEKIVVSGLKRFTGIDVGVSNDMWLAKFDENGTLIWESMYGITCGNISSFLAINLDYTAPSSTTTTTSTTSALDIFSYLIIFIVLSNWTRRKKEM